MPADSDGGQLLHYRTGSPITHRRSDHLWIRLGRHPPWGATQQINTHWLRHTTLTWVERHYHYGHATAHAYAGHSSHAPPPTSAPASPTPAGHWLPSPAKITPTSTTHHHPDQPRSRWRARFRTHTSKTEKFRSWTAKDSVLLPTTDHPPPSGILAQPGCTRAAPQTVTLPINFRGKECAALAQQKRVELIDDLDGSTGDETVRFGLEGASYEIDLSETHSAELRNSLTEFVEHARRVDPDKPTPQGARNKPAPAKPFTARQGPERTQAIRTWARAAGYEISDRGRISAHIINAYDRAH